MDRQRDEAPRQYYLAVDRQQFKMVTLVDLLNVIGRRFGLPIALCCSSRDSLDAVCATISSLPYISLSSLHSDLAEAERATSIEKFRQAIMEWNSQKDVEEEECHEGDVRRHSSYMLVMTDSCLPMQALGEAPISARVLINYDLPPKKEAYLRRLAACIATSMPITTSSKTTGLASPTTMTSCNVSTNHSHGNSGSIVINMVVGGEVVALRNIEEGCGIVIEEMPIHISELL